MREYMKKQFLIPLFVWILFWVVPWGKLLSVERNILLVFLVDMLRLGIALFLYIVPGMLLYVLLKRADEIRFSLPGILPIGFTFSVVLIAVVGLIGRLLGLSFAVVKYSFALIGLVEILLWMKHEPDFKAIGNYVKKAIQNAFRNPPLVIAFLMVILMTFHDNLFFIDDTTYLAYLTNWQHSDHLGFRNLVHEIDTNEHFRFWLALYPMGQALLADISGVPGLLLLGNYLEPYLIVLAVITSFWFARVLGLSRKAAGFAVLFQVTLYTWLVGDHFPIGMWFYQSMSEDKVTATFILAPVLFFFCLAFIQNHRKQNLFLIILAGVGLTLTHPVILFYAICIVVGMGLLALALKKTSWREIGQLAVVTVSLMVPYLFIRISDYGARTVVPYDAASASESFQIERYTHVVSDVFYGLNPGVLKFVDFEIENSEIYSALQIFRSIPIFIVLVAGGIAFSNLRKGPLYWYITICIFLITFAAIPYTGWILGYFVSARLISRTSWFSPLGLSSVLIVQQLMVWRENKSRSSQKNALNPSQEVFRTTMVMMLCLIFASPLLFYHFIPRIPAYFEVLDHNKQLAQIGAYIDRHTLRPVTVISLDYEDMQLLPGVSANSRLISFREEKPYNGFNSSLSVVDIQKRVDASNAIISLEQIRNGRVDNRCALMKEYNVKFVLAQYDTSNQFESLIKDCNMQIRIEFETDKLVLLGLTWY